MPLFGASQFDAVREFNNANQLFIKGNYAQAAEKYEELLSNNYKSSNVYFNLGNAYFRMDKIPEAIINFERAKRLSPADEDIDFNLNIANLKIVDKIEPVPEFFVYSWLGIVSRFFSSSGWAMLTVILIWVVFLCLTIFYIS